MIHLTKLGVDVPLGSFHGIRGVGATDRAVSLLDDTGMEHLLSISPPPGKPLTVEGEFGDLSGAQFGSCIMGLMLQDITQVHISDVDDPEFNTRTLRISNDQGLSFTWRLYCND